MSSVTKRRKAGAAQVPGVRSAAVRMLDVYADAPDVASQAVASTHPDVENLLEPTLGALIRLAGAAAGTLRIGGNTQVALGRVAGPGADAFAAWCESCDRADRTDSACVKAHLCRHEEAIPQDAFGPVCEHVIAVPLRHRGESVGTVHLMFDRAAELPDAMAPLLRATGDLIGLTLDNARLARENLRICLMAERQLMANEVHDSLAQGLTYMRMRMSLLRDAVRDGDEGRMIKLCADVDDALGDAHHRLREIILYFRSRMDPRGLHFALGEATEAFADRSGIAVHYDNRVTDIGLPAAREIEVFHVVQEALANVARHAGAQQVRVLLARDGADVSVTVEDDGVGIDHAVVAGDRDRTGHFGIAIMQERARRLGGHLEVLPLPVKGTAVRLSFPAAAPADEVVR